MFERLAEAMEELKGLDPTSLTGPELRAALGELHALAASLDAAQTRLTAAFDTSRDWQIDGARTTAAWLAWAHRVPASTAKARVALGRALRHLPAVEDAWRAGDIDIHHVRVLARARTEVTAEAFERDEKLLVDMARTMRFDRFARAVAYWGQLADPDGTEADAHALHQRRRAHVSKSFDGLWFGDFVLDPIAGAAFTNQLDRITDELYRAVRAAAQAEADDGVEITTVDIDRKRSPAQRRADALVEMARRAATAPPGGRRPDPLITVLVGYETVAGRICELADGTVVAPGSLLPWLDGAYIERVVFDGPSRVIDVGQARRCFDGATRRAIEVRDRECFHDTCATPAPRCQADHIQPFATGGPTTQANGQLACGPHNRGRQPPPAPAPADTG